MTGGAHDTLRDELADAIHDRWPGHTGQADYIVSAVLPVVRRYADAQVAAERARIAAEIEAKARTVDISHLAALTAAARIARGLS